MKRFDEILPALAIALLVLFWVAIVWLVSASLANAAEDFTLRNSCKGHWGDFTDGDINTAVDDLCDGPAQEDDDTLTNWSTGLTAVSDAPPDSRPGADSMLHDGSIQGCAFAITLADEYDLVNYVGWWKDPGEDVRGIRFRKGSGFGNSEEIRGQCSSAPQQKLYVEALQQAGGGALCTKDTWIFQAGTYDHDVTNTITTYSSLSTNSGTLWECNGDVACNTGDWGERAGAKTVGIGCASNATQRYAGNTGEVAFFAQETITAEETCEMCRCGIRGNVPGRGRVDTCVGGSVPCEARPYRSRCRRMM